MEQPRKHSGWFVENLWWMATLVVMVMSIVMTGVWTIWIAQDMETCKSRGGVRVNGICLDPKVLR